MTLVNACYSNEIDNRTVELFSGVGGGFWFDGKADIMLLFVNVMLEDRFTSDIFSYYR